MFYSIKSRLPSDNINFYLQIAILNIENQDNLTQNSSVKTAFELYTITIWDYYFYSTTILLEKF